ncbi:MAG: DUF72 domain-containing protein [Acidobacteria bacterium]|nr:DUF72 domain-containing protein [Acidobacteriota bacterium]
MSIFIGTSGWQYRHWRKGVFYPKSLRAADELAYYAERFQTVELNATFYKLPEAPVFEKWAAQVPSDFIFAMKASRFLTHFRQLKDPGEPTARLMRHSSPLGKHLGPVLLQLPARVHCNAARLFETCRAFPKRIRLAFEFRHQSWFCDEVKEILEANNAALCLTDRRCRWETQLWRTADWGYARFHEGTGRPRPCYEQAVLAQRTKELLKIWKAGEDLFVYFNNDSKGCAIRDARRFANSLSPHRRHSRVPEQEEVQVG